MTIGGIPEYLRVASGYSNYYQFIEREFGDANGYFCREPYFILSQKFREYSTYFSITNAISFGKIKPSEIAGFIGIENKRLYPYLQNLAKLMFISPSIPIDHRKGGGALLIKRPYDQILFQLCLSKQGIHLKGKQQIDIGFSSLLWKNF